MKIQICNDPTLVLSKCLRIRMKRREFFIWRRGFRLLFDTYREA
jgi:hypothetical protein